MLISCPNCATNFSVPDSTLGAHGRMLRCGRCGHKWSHAGAESEHDFGLDESSFPPPPAADDLSRKSPSESDFSSRPPFDLREPEPEFTLDDPPVPDFGVRQNQGAPPDIDLDGDPQPIPEVFASPPETKKGTAGLWVLLLILVLAASGVGIYHFQDKVVGIWPPAHQLLTELGLRVERPGAGLELKNAGTPERLVQNDSEILIVRGIIANVSDRERPVPTMKLVLLDKDRTVVQEKQSQPPVTALDPGGTAGFRIILERPDPSAVEVNVLFVDSGEAK